MLEAQSVLRVAQETVKDRQHITDQVAAVTGNKFRSDMRLDLSRRSTDSEDFEAGLRGKIVGQDEAVQAVVDLYEVFRAGLNSPGRPGPKSERCNVRRAQQHKEGSR
jgi:ATP-dependent Clp protease ATP-binding subunit ClpA